MSKSILLIGINYAPEITGIGKYNAEFVSYLATKKDFNVSVITGVPYYPQWNIQEGYSNKFTIEKSENIIIYRCPLYIPRKPRTKKRLLQDILFFVTAFLYVNRLIILRKKYELIFITVPSFSNGILGIYYKLFFSKTKIVYHVQDLQIDAADKLGMIRNNYLINFFFGIERFILNRVDIVSTISKGMMEKITSKTTKIKESIVFPNWIDSDNIYPISTELANDTMFKDKKIIFYSGAIGEKQGLNIIIDAAEYFKDNKELVFVISGEGPYRNKLKAYADEKRIDNVFFWDLLPITEFNKLLNSTFVHLVIQRESGSDLFLPSKLTNILGVGGCVIVTATENTSLYSIINQNKCGFLIPPSSLVDFCSSIKTLIDDENLRLELKHNALIYAQEHLYKAGIIDSFLEKINSLN